MGEIQSAYHRLAGERGDYLIQAQKNERYTVTVGLNYAGRARLFVHPDMYSSIGGFVVRSLASTFMSVETPPNVFWARYVIDTPDPKLGETTEIGTRLAIGERNLMRRFDEMHFKSRLFIAHVHSLVAGQMVCHAKSADDDGPDRARLFPLQNHVTQYIDSVLSRIITCEYRRNEPLDYEERPHAVYTDVDFIAGTVRQEEQDQIFEINDDAPVRWFVVSPGPPLPGENFSIAKVTNYIRDILNINGLTRAFQDIVYEAAKVIKGVRAGSGLNPHTLAKAQRGAFIVMRREDDIFYPNQGHNLSPGLAAVAQAKVQAEETLKRQWSVGVLSDTPRPNTAELTRQIAQEIQAVGSQHYDHHNDTVLLPLALALQDMDGFVIKGPEATIRPMVTTGLSAIARQQEANNLIGAIERIGGVAPDFIASLPKAKIFQRVMDALQIETSDLIPENAEIQDLISMLISKIQENPQQVLPMLIEIIKQFDPNLLASLMNASGPGGGVDENGVPILPSGQPGQGQPQQQAELPAGSTG